MIYRKHILFWLFVVFSANALAQENVSPLKEKTNNAEQALIFVDEMPTFIGGEKALSDYIDKNLVYPERAIENRIEGAVIVSFTIKKDGTITDAIVVKDMGFGCGEEALRLVNEMPKWKPGNNRGKPVSVNYKLYVTFDFDKNENRNSVNEFEKKDTKPTIKDFDHSKFGVGITAGWGNAYGNFGGEANYRLSNFLEVNAGLGIGFAGLNIGVGSRIYLPKKEFTPFVGIHLVHAINNISESTQTTRGETCVYQRNSNQAWFVNGGVKFPVFYSQWLFITGGYSWTVSENEVFFIEGVDTDNHRKFMETSGLGGIQVGFTLIYSIK